MIHHRCLIVLLAALVSSVHGHGAMVAVQGANGMTATGMGIDASTPRDGSRRRPFQQDTSIIRDEEIEEGEAGPCGRTLAGGSNDVAAEVDAAAAAGMPSMAEDGTVSMTIHQVNGDGAGPYTCEISTDATGETFTPMTVTTNVPGRNSRSRTRATAFPLVAQAPAGTACTGGPDGNACIVRCRNDARAGPFGGCAVVTNPEAAAAETTAAAEASAAEGTEAAGTAADEAATATGAAEGAAETATEAATEAGTEDAATGAVRGAATGANRANRANAGAGNRANGANAAATEEEFDRRNRATDEAYAIAEAEEIEEEEFLKRSLPGNVKRTNSVAKRDQSPSHIHPHSRRRMVNSRVVGVEKRGKWI